MTHPTTPYEIALQVAAEVGGGELWPHHPSGLCSKVREILDDVAAGGVWRDRHGYVVPCLNFPEPWMRALGRAGLVRPSSTVAEDGSYGIVLTDIGRTVVDGTFVAKAPDLLDVLAAQS